MFSWLPMSVMRVRMEVIEREARAGIELRLTQNDTHDKNTIRVLGT